MTRSSQQEAKQLAQIYRSLGSEVRLKIIKLILSTDRPLHIQAIADSIGRDYAGVYRQIRTLRNSGLVDVYEVGRSRVVSIKKVEELENVFEASKALIG
ncbi:MAG: winged helix-turn-helix domain-containing protein [Nitrososphaerales archaeon]